MCIQGNGLVNEYEKKLKEVMQKNNIHAEHLSFKQSCHSVEEAANAANVAPEDFVKNICMIGQKYPLKEPDADIAFESTNSHYILFIECVCGHSPFECFFTFRAEYQIPQIF